MPTFPFSVSRPSTLPRPRSDLPIEQGNDNCNANQMQSSSYFRPSNRPREDDRRRLVFSQPSSSSSSSSLSVTTTTTTTTTTTSSDSELIQCKRTHGESNDHEMGFNHSPVCKRQRTYAPSMDDEDGSGAWMSKSPASVIATITTQETMIMDHNDDYGNNNNENQELETAASSTSTKPVLVEWWKQRRRNAINSNANNNRHHHHDSDPRSVTESTLFSYDESNTTFVCIVCQKTFDPNQQLEVTNVMPPNALLAYFQPTRPISTSNTTSRRYNPSMTTTTTTTNTTTCRKTTTMCTFCERAACSFCLHACQECNYQFCSFCSTTDERTRTVCLDCCRHPNGGSRGDSPVGKLSTATPHNSMQGEHLAHHYNDYRNDNASTNEYESRSGSSTRCTAVAAAAATNGEDVEDMVMEDL